MNEPILNLESSIEYMRSNLEYLSKEREECIKRLSELEERIATKMARLDEYRVAIEILKAAKP